MCIRDSVRPGSDAAVVRVHGTNKGIAISTDCSPIYCKHNSFEGGKHAIVETWRNIIASGALPIAVTDCMNFGNPEKPEIMGEFVECIRGMAESCSYLNYPVISGNVSLYNETNGVGIYPTPAIGGVGLIKDLSQTMTIGLKNEGNIICVIGETSGHLNMSQYLSIIKNKEEGCVPEINLEIEKKNGMFVLDCIEGYLTASVHDIGEGGLLIAMSEMGSISERRIFKLISGTRGLPPFLVSNPGLNSGFMISQYTCASIVSQNKQLCTPASIDSIDSSNGQEDHVSMGANAATKCFKILRNVQDIIGIELLSAAQAMEFRRPLRSSKVNEDLL